MEPRPHDGFTLIELLMTLAIAAILMAAAAPSFRGVAARSRIVTTGNTLVGTLNLARQHAVMSGGKVMLCPSRDGHACDASAHWEQGWLVATDRDGHGTPGTVLRVQDALPAGTVVISSIGRTRVRYRIDGSSPGTNLSLIVCQQGRLQDARAVVVSNSGRPRQARATPAQAAQCAGA